MRLRSWRGRRVALADPLCALRAVGAGLLIGTSTVGTAFGLVLAFACALYVWLFVRVQWRTAAAMSVWFGVERMRWLPRMTPQRFDEWRKLRGLKTPEERALRESGAVAAPSEASRPPLPQ